MSGDARERGGEQRGLSNVRRVLRALSAAHEDLSDVAAGRDARAQQVQRPKTCRASLQPRQLAAQRHRASLARDQSSSISNPYFNSQ